MSGFEASEYDDFAAIEYSCDGVGAKEGVETPLAEQGASKSVSQQHDNVIPTHSSTTVISVVFTASGKEELISHGRIFDLSDFAISLDKEDE